MKSGKPAIARCTRNAEEVYGSGAGTIMGNLLVQASIRGEGGVGGGAAAAAAARRRGALPLSPFLLDFKVEIFLLIRDLCP